MCPESSHHKTIIRREATGWLLGKLAVMLIAAVATLYYSGSIFLGSSGSFRPKRVVFAILCFAVLTILSVIKIEFSTRAARTLNALLSIITILYSVVISDEIVNREVMDELMEPIPTFSKERVCIFVSITTVTLIFLLILFMTNRASIAAIASSVIVYALSLAVITVCDFRGTPLLASDFTSAKAAMNVAGTYKFTPAFTEYASLMGMIVLAFAFTQIRGVRFVNSIPVRGGLLLATVILSVFFVNTVVLSDFLPERGIQIQDWRPINSYRTYGTITTFLRSIDYSLIEKPDGYSTDAVRAITEKYSAERSADPAAENDSARKQGEYPNVIIVVNEAFADLKVLGDFETDRDYMPVYNGLKDNCVKGYYYASVLGGGTAITEFELLTSCTSAFNPMGVQPFEAYIRSDVPALPAILNSMDYTCGDALHPKDAWNYNRIEAYPSLGFNDFISIEDLPDDMDKVHGHVSDRATYDYIIDMYEKSDKEKPFFIYDLTMQNHSPYNKGYEADEPVRITDDNYDVEAEEYLNLISESDRALGSLIDYFSRDDRPTVILFMGDHQPRITDEFLRSVTDGKNAEWTEEESLVRYKTPFLIWANFDIGEEDVDSTSANYIQSILLETADLPETDFQKYLVQLRRKIPWINSLGYMGDDGNFYKVDDVNSPYYEDVNEYRMLQYNYLFGGKDRMDSFFKISGH